MIAKTGESVFSGVIFQKSRGSTRLVCRKYRSAASANTCSIMRDLEEIEGGTVINFLEQLTAEWYEFSGYFVRRNVRVGPRPNGGHECELDVVAFHPKRKHLVQIEPSMDAVSWAKREKKYAKKFEAGRKYIPSLFEGFDLPFEIDQIALLVFGSMQGRNGVGGGRILMIGDFMQEIRDEIITRRIESGAIPEQYQILRALQFAAKYWNADRRR